jgi:hypothetical protein
MKLIPWLASALALIAPSASAHVGSPDVYFETTSGPYRLFVTIRVPQVVPGIARIEVQVLEGPVESITITPARIVGEGSQNAPPPDRLSQAPGDPHRFTGELWLMESGSWQVRMGVSGTAGQTSLSVPVQAFAQRTLRMQKLLGGILFGLMLFLVASLVSIAGVAVRESQLEPGSAVPLQRKRRGRIASAVTVLVAVTLIFLGNLWWNSEASARATGMLYKAPPIEASLGDNSTLRLKMLPSSWHERRSNLHLVKLIPDHGHLMHLFLVRKPGMDQFFHLHPEQGSTGLFTEVLREIPAGEYALFADVVRESGFADTMTTSITLPATTSPRSLSREPDDAGGAAPPATQGSLAAASSPLASGGRVIRLDAENAIRSGQSVLLRFQVEDRFAQPETHLEPYMGMAGHLIVIRTDFSVFAHVHPAGSVPMAALALVEQNPLQPGQTRASSMREAMPGMHHHGAVPAEMSFPYGFPQPGRYRLFLQFRQSGQVQTAAFDLAVN